MFNCAAGSKSDGQKSPSDSVFLRMDEIPYIREDRAETDTHTGTASKYMQTADFRPDSWSQRYY